MENNPESKEPTSIEIESKEREIADGSGERKGVVATAADSEKEEILKKETKIEQRPFLTQSELLAKMKAGEEEEVKRCQKPEFLKFVSTIMIFRSALEGWCVACLRMASQYIATGFTILISNPVGVDHLPRGCRHDAYQTRGPSLDPGQEEELKFSPVLSRSPAISIKLPSLRIFLTNMASMSVCHHQCHQAIVGEQGRGRRSRRHARASEA